MSYFCMDDYEILFKKDWHTKKLAKDIAEIDRQDLHDEYKKLFKNRAAPPGQYEVFFLP